MNPFAIPERSHLSPLCPWQHATHESRYAAVDNAEPAFSAFVAVLGGWALHDRGLAILATGPRGAGKTALLHRCAHRVRETIAQEHDKQVLIADLSDEGFQGSPSADQALSILEALIDFLADQPSLLNAEQLALLRERAGGAARLLSRTLGEADAILCAVLPPIETPAQLTMFANMLLRKNLVLLIETEFEKVRAACQREYGPGGAQHVPVLELGPVAPGPDAWTFVSTQLAAMPSGTAVPTITQETVSRFIAARTEGGQTATVGELQRTFYAVFDRALRAARQTIEYDDFGTYYISLGNG